MNQLLNQPNILLLFLYVIFYSSVYLDKDENTSILPVQSFRLLYE